MDSGERSTSVISSGVSGLTSSYVLSAINQLTLFEEATTDIDEPQTLGASLDRHGCSPVSAVGASVSSVRQLACGPHAKGAPTPLADGEVIAGYTILRPLGAGGMGEVYLAQHPRLPRCDALKLLSAAACADSEVGQRFNREADIAATLWHPHIVQVHDRGEVDGRLWIAMDYVEGTDAARLLAERYPEGMPPDEVLRIVTAVAEALDYAHQSNLTHRDVKPANILISRLNTNDERIMLADFGIARRGDDASGLTGTNMTVGTVAYAAPEQLKGEEIDGRADQYALAAAAFQLLTGSPPFQHSNPAVVIGQHLTSAPPDIGSRRPELSGLGPAFDKALAKSREDRYDRCIDFARALAQRVGAAGAGVQADATILASAAPAETPGAALAAVCEA